MNVKDIKINTPYSYLIIAFVGLWLFLPGLGSVHLFDWDEINFAESAREMMITGNYLDVQVNYELFWEKPPLFIWMQVVAMKLFGINEFAARFPNAIAGVVTLLALFRIGSTIKDRQLGWLWVALYVGSIFPFFYFKSGIIDPWFNLFTFVGIYYFVRYTYPQHASPPLQNALLSALFIGLAILTKGPVALLVFGLTLFLFWVFDRCRWRYPIRDVLLYVLVLSFVGGFWFILQIANGNFTIIQDFIVYQIRLFSTKDAGHGGFLLYHFVFVLIGVFPASIFALSSFRKKAYTNQPQPFVQHTFRWMMILFWVVMILFTIVKTKIVHYASLSYFPLTFLSALYLHSMLKERKKLPRYMLIMVLILATIYGLAIAILPSVDSFKHLLIPYIQDEFAIGNLQATSSWYGFEPLIGLLLVVSAVVFYLLARKGKTAKALSLLLLGSTLYVSLTMYFVVPQIEKYSQAAALDFYISKKGEDCYIYPTSKSYAHYFYSDRVPENKNADETYLFTGEIDKTCYFVVKNIRTYVADFEQKVPDAHRLYDKNGFVFYERKPIKK